MQSLSIHLLCCTVLFSLLATAAAVDTITADQVLRDGDTIVSAGESFELGFFSPGNSTNRYLGIWYKKVTTPTVVWVANREIPLPNNSSGVLQFNKNGMLLVHDGSGRAIWSSNSSGSFSNFSPLAQLLDTGNLVIRNSSSSNPENFIWQSFDYPGDTFLPGMKLGKDFTTGFERILTSWRNKNDPSPGDYSISLDTAAYASLVLRNGSGFTVSRSNGQLPSIPSSVSTYQFVLYQKEIYYKYELLDSNSVVSRMVLEADGMFNVMIWRFSRPNWLLYSTWIRDQCYMYGLCGIYGVCSIYESPACKCMEGFAPKSSEEYKMDWTVGCQRKVTLGCGNGDVFQSFSNVSFPDTRNSWFKENMWLGECESECKNNCSCTAYATVDFTGGGSGCLVWFGDLLDLRVTSRNQALYVRMAASKPLLENRTDQKQKKKIIKVILSTSITVGFLGLSLTAYACRQKKKKRQHSKRKGILGQTLNQDYTIKNDDEDCELPLFGFSEITNATDNFSSDKKIGEGGFGQVYKGVLKEGKEIAVKRLSQTSKQGLVEFKNEIVCIAKLQHRNLVKLLGYCIQGEETLLIYEYMPNKSLDLFIFDKTNRTLDWPQRLHIINGISRGLLYLHQDSRLRIIHRDLKAGNILLDAYMNPKISDFGLARMFGGYETAASTNKIVGTYGYISPEYALNGLYSVKSDIFSFGVLLLEIISGKRNRGFSQQEHHDSLLGHAWRLYKDGKSLELIDASLHNSCTESEALRAIHVGLLCVQHQAEDRPTMSSVVLMLGGEGMLPTPKEPGFFTNGCVTKVVAPGTTSVNEVTLTLLDAR